MVFGCYRLVVVPGASVGKSHLSITRGAPSLRGLLWDGSHCFGASLPKHYHPGIASDSGLRSRIPAILSAAQRLCLNLCYVGCRAHRRWRDTRPVCRTGPFLPTGCHPGRREVGTMSYTSTPIPLGGHDGWGRLDPFCILRLFPYLVCIAFIYPYSGTPWDYPDTKWGPHSGIETSGLCACLPGEWWSSV